MDLNTLCEVEHWNGRKIDSDFFPSILKDSFCFGDGFLWKLKLSVMKLLIWCKKLQSDFVPVSGISQFDGKVIITQTYVGHCNGHGLVPVERVQLSHLAEVNILIFLST